MNLDRFQKWAVATLLATLLLVFVGGIVRVSGAGLGCPDWPKCWGHWWPPSSPGAIDASLYDVAQFNPLKMWTEYVNRLVGVAIGFLVLGTFLLSLVDRRSDRPLVWASAAALALVAFQGWLGGKVVHSGLAGGMVTLHLGCAVLLVALLVWVVFRAGGSRRLGRLDDGQRARLRAAALAMFAVSTVQVVLGARVREAVDEVVSAGVASGVELGRGDLLAAVGWEFPVHRTFAWVLVLAAVALVWVARRAGAGGRLAWPVWAVVGVVGLQVATGASLAYLGMPPVPQALHLGFSVVLCALAFQLVLVSGRPAGVAREEVTHG